MQTTDIRLLWLKQRFAPEPSPLRGLDFSLALQGNGIQVAVATGFPYYPGTSLYPGYKQRLHANETIRGVTIHRNFGVVGHSGSSLKRALAYATMPTSAYVNALRKKFSPDVVLATLGPGPYATAGKLIARHLDCPLILDIQDLWPESLTASGMWPERIPTAPIERMLSSAYRSADAIICLSDGCRDQLLQRGANGPSTHTVLNWPPSVESTEADQHRTAEIIGSRAGKYFCYTGALGPLQGIDHMIDATVSAGPDFQLIVAGSGRDEALLREAARERGNGQVEFVGQQSPGVAQGLCRSALANVLHLAPSPLDASAVPSKLSGYLAAGRPVVVAATGETARIAHRADAGPICEPQSRDELARGFSVIANATRPQRDVWASNAQAFAEENLSFAKAARDIASIVRQVANARS